MEEKERDLERIEQYLNDQLSAEERTAVEHRLSEDKDFLALKEDFVALKEGIEQAGRNALRHTMDSWEKDLGNPLEEPQGEQRSLGPSLIMRWAAVFLVGVVSVVAWYFGANQSHKRLYNNYFEVYANVVLPNTRSNETLTKEEQAFLAYDNEDYERAVQLFNQILEAEQKEYVLFYSAQAHMVLNEHAEAIKYLQDVLRRQGLLVSQARWYLALCYLHTKETEKAKEQLKVLAEGDSSYSERANELLQEM